MLVIFSSSLSFKNFFSRDHMILGARSLRIVRTGWLGIRNEPTEIPYNEIEGVPVFFEPRMKLKSGLGFIELKWKKSDKWILFRGVTIEICRQIADVVSEKRIGIGESRSSVSAERSAELHVDSISMLRTERFRLWNCTDRKLGADRDFKVCQSIQDEANTDEILSTYGKLIRDRLALAAESHYGPQLRVIGSVRQCVELSWAINFFRREVGISQWSVWVDKRPAQFLSRKKSLHWEDAKFVGVIELSRIASGEWALLVKTQTKGICFFPIDNDGIREAIDCSFRPDAYGTMLEWPFGFSEFPVVA